MPEDRYRSWEFDEDEAAARDRPADLVSALARHATPFIDRHADLSVLVEALRSGSYGVPEQNAFRAPVGLDLLGRHDEAVQVVRDLMAELQDRDDLAARAYQDFAERFLGPDE